MYRTLLGILATFAAALLVAGLTFSTTHDEPADFRFVNGTEPKSLDPQLTTGEPESRLTDALFEGLTRFDARTLRPEPGVAESWTISDDGAEYVFRLRKDARWSDGEPVTAHDFVRSWQRLLEPSTAAEYAYMLFPVRHAEAKNTFDGHAQALETKIVPALDELLRAHADGVDARTWQRFVIKHKLSDPLRAAERPALLALLGRHAGQLAADELRAFRDGLRGAVSELRSGAATARAHFGRDQGAVALDAHTLRVELRAPTPYFLELLCHHSSYPVPKFVSERPSDDWFLPETIVSNGAFRLARWVVNDHIRLERSETYWDRKNVKLARIDALPTENATLNLNLYLTGAIDWLPKYFPAELASRLRERPDFHSAPGLSVYFYRFNTTKKPLDDRRVRKAISLAVDRNTIVREVRGLGELPAYTLIPPGIAGYESPESALRYDVAEARRLLAEAGYPGGRGFPKLSILYNTLEDHKRLAEFISDQLRRNLGIEIGAYNQEWQSYLDTQHSMDYELSRAGWIGDYIDPNTFLNMWVTNGDNNYTGFSSPAYDRLIRFAGDIPAFLRDPEAVLATLREPNAARELLEPARSGGAEERADARSKLRFRLFREAEAILVQDEFPIMPLFFYVDASLLRDHVRGFSMRQTLADGSTAVNLQDRHPLRALWLARPREGRP